MPLDRNDEGDFKEEEAPGMGSGAKRRFKDFDCPDCAANNPYDEEPFGDGDEITCFYCGSQFNVSVNDDGKLRLREA
jgi:hypothetical protein